MNVANLPYIAGCHYKFPIRRAGSDLGGLSEQRFAQIVLSRIRADSRLAPPMFEKRLKCQAK